MGLPVHHERFAVSRFRKIQNYLTLRAALLLIAAATFAPSQELRSITSIFNPQATPADRIFRLSVLVLVICTAVFIVVATLIAAAVIRFRRKAGDNAEPAQIYGSNQIEIAWTVIPILIVVVLTTATARITSAVQDHEMPKDALEVSVIGHQYWWEFRYPGLGIVTANELHVPANTKDEPRISHLTLTTADVVHSFWVPELGGKTDLIPTQINHAWLDPARPAVYFGNCAELCGVQHANMLLRVVVDSPSDFRKWGAHQQEAAAESAPPAERMAFLTSPCVACHTVRGTTARGVLGPDLTHLMTRSTLTAREFPNNQENLKAWIHDPQALKPGSKMPSFPLPATKLEQITSYLGTLN